MKRAKNYRAVTEKLEERSYSLEEAIAFLIENSKTKFDQSLEMHLRLNIDPKKGDQQVRASIVLPHGTGKELKIAVITTTMAAEAKKSGAAMVGGEEMIADIKSGKFFDGKYDVVVATPEMMPKLASVARILGPKGLMPNPKSETVTTKIAQVVASLKKGKVQFKNDAGSNIHQSVGKLSMGSAKLKENAEVFLDAVKKAKPTGAKGRYILNISMCSTMSPGILIHE
ncbi:MAG: 50S ribosomal protein L1 [Candidatus Moraniibacteriota bacterium]|nr:MAG: 50S ribosomal protein L1 [Candidatus Moranbacteria bacterium]